MVASSFGAQKFCVIQVLQRIVPQIDHLDAEVDKKKILVLNRIRSESFAALND